MHLPEYNTGNGRQYIHSFFFQAEDGIRDLTVTGVQTCALPIWVVDIEHEIEGAARQPDSGDRDLLEGDLRLGERQPAEGGAGETEGGKGRQQAVEGGRGHSVFSSAALRLSSAHHSIRCLMSFSNPNSVGSYQRAPRSTSGRYSCST